MIVALEVLGLRLTFEVLEALGPCSDLESRQVEDLRVMTQLLVVEEIGLS